MRIIILLFISNFCFSQSFLSNQKGGIKQAGTTYYISSSGNDSNSGLSPAQAVTENKISSLSLNNGDSLNFKRGDTFVIGDISQSVTGLYVNAYGSGANPKVYGSTDLSGATWTSVGSGVWSTPLATAPLWIYINDAAIGVAASNTLTVSTISTNVITLTSVIPLSGYGSSFIGAKVRGQANNWIMSDEYTVTAYNAGAKTITVDKNVAPGMAGKFCIMYMQQQFLTSNTWFFDSGTNTLYVKTQSGATPAGTNIRAGTYNTFILNQMQLTMSNMELLHYQTKVVSYGPWSLIYNCSIHDCRGVAAFGNYAMYSRIINNTIHHCDLNGIFSFRGDYSYYYGNTVYDISSGAFNLIGFPTGSDALQVGQAGYPNSVTGIEFQGYGITSMRETSSSILKNNVYNLGYVGIHLSSSTNCLVDKNYVHDHTGTILNDGALIYTAGAAAFTNTSSTISNNILLNGGTNNLLGGVYVDNYSSDMVVTGNSTNNAGANNGILINTGTRRSVVTNNKVVSAGTRGGIVFVEVGGFPFTNSGCTCTGNQVAMQFGYGALGIQQAFNPFTGGTCDNNIYVSPYDASKTVNRNSVFYNLATWKTVLSTDASSTEKANYLTYSNATNAACEVKMEMNPSDNVESFNVPAGYTDINGNAFSNPVSIPAWSSLIYLKSTTCP